MEATQRGPAELLAPSIKLGLQPIKDLFGWVRDAGALVMLGRRLPARMKLRLDAAVPD